MNNKDKSNILQAISAFLLASLGMIAYTYSTRFSINFPEGASDTIGFMPADLIFLIVLTVLYFKFLKQKGKFNIAFAIISLVVSLTSVMLTDIYKYKKYFYLLKTVPALYVICIFGYAFMYYAALCFVDELLQKNISQNAFNKEYKPIKLALTLMLASLPVYAIMFPGSVRFEAGLTIGMISGDFQARYIAPPFWKAFVSVFYHIGKALGSDTAGLVIYFAVVGFVSFYALALIIIRAAKLNINKHILIFFIIFTGFNPYLILKTYTMKYDALLAIAMLYLAIMLYDMVNEGDEFITPVRLIALGIISFAVCAFRSAGINILLITLLFVTIYAIKRFAKRGLYIILSIVLGVSIYLSSAYIINKSQNLPNYNTLGNYGVVLQQMGYTLQKHGTDALTEEEKSELSKFMLPTTFEMHYKPNIVDNILCNIEGPWKDKELSAENRHRLLKVWKSLGKRYPKGYATAFFMNSNRFITPGYYDDIDLFGSYYHQSLTMDSIPDSYKPFRHGEDWQNSLEYFKYIAGYVSVYGVYMGCGYINMLLLIMAYIIRRNKCSLLPILPAIFYAIGTLFSPVNGWIRYLTPVGFTIPLAMLYTLYSYKKFRSK